MNSKRSPRALVVLTSLVGALLLTGVGMVDAKPKTRIGLARARAIALATVPGRVVEEELERERGRRIYSFEIAATGGAPGRITEVNIDARDGTVVGIEDEPADADEDRD